MKTLEFTTSENNLIRYKIFNQGMIGKKNLVIIVHGFKGFMDWGFFPYAANYFAEKNYPVLTFNFSHNGVGEDLLNFTELDKFAVNTYSLETKELSEIIKAYSEGYFGNSDNRKLNLIGHSRGGVSVVINSQNELVDKFVTWAGVSDIDRFSTRQKKEWRETGEFQMINARTGQMMNLSVNLLDDIEQNKETTLNIKSVLERNEKPYLIIQGEQDLAVKVPEAENLKKWTGENSEYYLIPATGHTFDVVHPFQKTTENFEKVLNKTSKFFEEII